jgi:hypothetical protein
MRVILFTLGLLFASAPAAHTQPVWTPLEGRLLFSINGLAQPTTQELTQNLTSTLYGEDATLETLQSIKTGGMIDFSIGARIWRNVGLSVGVSSASSGGDASVSVTIPHPLFYSQPRSLIGEATDLRHKERVVHLQFMWIQRLPRMEALELAVSAGPSFFSIKQMVAEGVRVSETGPPYTGVQLDEVTLVEHKRSPIGGNVGIDVTYLITPNLGGGIFWRYASASTEFPLATGVVMPFRAGGSQIGGGLRLRF